MSKKEIKSEITINAEPQMVWKYLTDFESYGKWNPFILSFAGRLAEGKRVKVTIKPHGSKPMNFNPTLLKVENNKEIRWLGSLPLKGVFDREHYLKLIDNGDNTTKLIQGEIFSGVLVPFMKNMIEVKTLEGFRAMNRQLKARIESGSF